MTDVDLDDLDLTEDEDDDNYVRIRKDHLTSVRKRAKQASQFESDLGTYRRNDAIVKAGLTDLTDKQRAALAKIVDDPTPEALRAEAEALGWVQATPEPELPPDEDTDALAAIAAAGQGASVVIAPRNVSGSDVEGWAADKRMRLLEQHPDLHEQLMRGNTIELPSGFA